MGARKVTIYETTKSIGEANPTIGGILFVGGIAVTIFSSYIAYGAIIAGIVLAIVGPIQIHKSDRRISRGKRQSMALFRKKPQAAEVSLHDGHVAALGEKCALMASQMGICHNALQDQNLSFHKDTIYILGLDERGNRRKIKWPEQALGHVEDIKVFYNSFGPNRTGSLRLGYVFHLGPIAELIFFLVANNSSTSNFRAFPESITHQWKKPDPSLGLKSNSTLTDEAEVEITKQGIAARRNKETDLARQCFLRSFMAGLANKSSQQQYASMMNLVTTYIDEQRWFRAYSLCMLALLLAVDLPKEKSLVEKYSKPLYLELSNKVNEAVRLSIESFFKPSKPVSIPELMW